MNLWLEANSYWSTNCHQLDTFWKRSRIARITGSKIAALVGNSHFSSPQLAAQEICGLTNVTINQDMQRGLDMEAYARDWLASKLGQPISEIGLAVPKWDLRFGASVDGLLEEAICEIKIPREMYAPLKLHRSFIQSGRQFEQYYHDHIWDNHYDQMQLGMAVTGKLYCYYLVYLPSDRPSVPKDWYCEKVSFNPEYWCNLYDKACSRYREYIEPLIKHYSIERIDPI